jgi:flagellar motility protein MotE (MotC chaperone)
MREVKDRLGILEGKIESLEADVKELYKLITRSQQQIQARKGFEKLSFDQKLVQVYEDVRALAKEAGIALPQ